MRGGGRTDGGTANGGRRPQGSLRVRPECPYNTPSALFLDYHTGGFDFGGGEWLHGMQVKGGEFRMYGRWPNDLRQALKRVVRHTFRLRRPLSPVQFDSPELAMAVAAEWDAQDPTKGIEPAVMPIMSLASTAIDQVSQPVCDHVTRVNVSCVFIPRYSSCTLCFLRGAVLRKSGQQPATTWAEAASIARMVSCRKELENQQRRQQRQQRQQPLAARVKARYARYDFKPGNHHETTRWPRTGKRPSAPASSTCPRTPCGEDQSSASSIHGICKYTLGAAGLLLLHLNLKPNPIP